MEPLLTIKDMSRLLKVDEEGVRRMCRSKRIRAWKVGREWRTSEDALKESMNEAELP